MKTARGNQKIPDDVRKAIAEARRNGEMNKSVASRFQVSEGAASVIAKSFGVPPALRWSEVVDYASHNPTHGDERIAAVFGIEAGQVHTILTQHWKSRGASVLGRAAASAGLSLADIRNLVSQRGAA